MEVVDPEVAVRWPVCRHVQIPVCSRLQLSPICPPGRRCLDNPSVLRMWLCMRIMLAGRGGVRDHRGEQARPKAFHMRSWQKPVALLLGLCFCAPTVYGFRLNLPSRPVVTRRAGPSPSTRERRQTVRCLIDFKSMGNLPPAEKLSYEQTDGKRVTFAASRSAEREVTEGVRPVMDYMALPPSQYSVLDEEAITRLGEDTFRCEITSLNFFGYRLVPIIYIRVLVEPEHGRSVLNVFKMELTGSRIAEIANGTFEVKARNVVAYRPTETPSRKQLMSTVSVEVQALVPRGNIIPPVVLAKGGSLVIQGVLNVMVPRFLKVLSKDYEKWSMGDDSREAVADKAFKAAIELEQV